MESGFLTKEKSTINYVIYENGKRKEIREFCHTKDGQKRNSAYNENIMYDLI